MFHVATTLDADLVVELDILGGKARGKLEQRLPVAMAVIHGIGHHLGDRQAMQHAGDVIEYRGKVRPLLGQGGHLGQQPGGIDRGQGLDQPQDMAMVESTEHRRHVGMMHLALAKGDRLVGKAHGVAHGALGGLAQQPEGTLLEGHLLGFEYLGQVADDALGRHMLEGELQTARQHRGRQLLRIGGRQQKLHVRGRLLQGLQQGIEAAGGEHVHLIDEVHLVAPLGGGVLDVVEQLTGIFHLGARCRVDLDQVHEATLVDGATAVALAARRRGHARVTLAIRRAVQALGQDPRQGGLAHPAGAGEQVGVVQPPLIQGIDQGALDMLLADQFMKGTRSPLAGQNLIAHAARDPCGKTKNSDGVTDAGGLH
ncbi:hypothetical protein HALO32_03134 [Halomonas lysinitropha]|uniref:Uncharacterized protein n=1 Tax=Halomonas lysinitropha TaxID=2607506 RepID=A0A5K1IC84_9GAMM|nr:hypothetical protein HALO32_03134 [Halomonas lysinitropha]